MYSFKEGSKAKNIKSIPFVEFDSLNSEMKAIGLFNTDKNIYEYLGLLLLKLGFKSEDNVKLYNYDKENCSFDCMVNDKDYCHIRLKDSEYREIILSKFNIEFGYKCVPNEKAETGMIISLCRYCVKYPNGLIFTRYLSEKEAKFKFELNNYCWELDLIKPKNLKLPLFDNKGHYSKYILDNEEELIKYLGDLKFPISIISVYNTICDKYLGDISKYPKFNLMVSKLQGDNSLRVTDLISLFDGNLDKFGITSNDKGMSVFLDKDDNWSFELFAEDNVPVNFVMSQHNGEINCSFSASEEVDLKYYTGKIIQSDFNRTYEEVLQVKRRVKSLFDLNNKDSN